MREGDAMTITNKEKKRWNRRQFRIEEKIDILYTIAAVWLFVLFSVVLLADQLIGKVFFPYINMAKGFGPGQVIIALGILLNMWWLKRMMK